jgi:hypothetical protein
LSCLNLGALSGKTSFLLLGLCRSGLLSAFFFFLLDFTGSDLLLESLQTCCRGFTFLCELFFLACGIIPEIVSCNTSSRWVIFTVDL